MPSIPDIPPPSFRSAERSRRLARAFKLVILGVTALVLAGMVAGTSPGRYAAGWVYGKARRGIGRLVGSKDDRAWVDEEWRRRRLFDMERARIKLRSAYDGYDPKLRELVRAAGLDPDHALLRWGNFDKALLLPATVFLPDDSGRSYRFRPDFRSIWIRNFKSREGVLAYFPIPDEPGVLKLAEDAGAAVVRESVQTTNSWGLRGGEPNLSAELGGIVLGDSYMQGLFVGDDQTPVECLKRVLAEHFGTTVETLNTGHLGYSPEQEYFTLLEYADRFPPRFVVLSLFANDFGDLFEVLEGRADWEENRYWIGEIASFCAGLNVPLLVVPAPWAAHVEGVRRTAHYPGRVPDVLPESAVYFDPMEDFIAANDRETARLRAEGKSLTPSPLFNGHIADGHFSTLGCRVWGDSVGRRLARLLEQRGLTSATGDHPGRISDPR